MYFSHEVMAHFGEAFCRIVDLPDLAHCTCNNKVQRHTCKSFEACAMSSLLMQEEYAREGIDWSYVEFIDNQECLDLLEGAPNAPALAVFPLIDEACRLPRATYQVHISITVQY